MIKEKELFNRFVDEANQYASRLENKIIEKISTSFPYYILKLFYKLSNTEICEALRGLGSHDYGLDAFFMKEDEKTIYFIQFKSSEFLSKAETAKPEWFLTLSDITRRITQYIDTDNINSSRINEIIFEEYPDIIDKFRSAHLTYEIKKVVFHMEDASLNTLMNHPDIEYYNLEDILNIYQKNLDEDSEEIVSNLEIDLKPQYPEMFGANPKTYIEFTQNSFNGRKKKSCIFPISALALINMINDKSTKLLERNVRGYLGHNNDVNKGIINTAINHPESFYYFNNGISISCDSLRIDEESNTLFLIDPQIINGAQTIHSLEHAFKILKNIKEDKIKSVDEAKKHISKIHVLCRVMETDKNFGNSGIKDKLTYSTSLTTFNNKQNKMKVTDFFSGNKEQIYIKEALQNLNVGYLIKRGKTYEEEMLKYKYQIDMETLGEMYLQAHQIFPVSASKIFSKNFEHNPDYQDVFNDYSRKTFDYYFIAILHSHLFSTFKKIKYYFDLENEHEDIPIEEKEKIKDDLTRPLYAKVERFHKKIMKHTYALDYKLFFHLVYQVLQQKIIDDNYDEIFLKEYIEKFKKNTSNIDMIITVTNNIIPIALEIYAKFLQKIITDSQLGKRLPKTKKTIEIIQDIFEEKMSNSWSIKKKELP